MSRYFADKYSNLVPYVPGEQPQDQKYIKLNTNENPFLPFGRSVKLAKAQAKRLKLYSDPECRELRREFAKAFKVDEDQVLFGNGSDELLYFAFMAFCDDTHPAAFADITYGFYPVYAEVNHIPYTEIPLKDDFSICLDDYLGINKTIFIANPNAPTGIALSLSDIEKVVKTNPDNVVVVDEAYVDFGAESCLPLIHKYDNLLVIQTFSKSRSMAGARLGFCVGSKELIQDIKTLKYSVNPYNINRMTMAAGIGALQSEKQFLKYCKTIECIREKTAEELKNMGFVLTDSKSNFLFARHPEMSGEDLYLKLKERGVLVRYFSKPRISQHIRITVGSRKEMKIFLKTLAQILEENNENR